MHICVYAHYHELTSFEECDTAATIVLSRTSLNSKGTCKKKNWDKHTLRHPIHTYFTIAPKYHHLSQSLQSIWHCS